MADFYVEQLANTLRSLKSTGTFEDIKKLVEQIELSNIINSSIAVLNNNGYNEAEKQIIIQNLKEYASPKNVSNTIKKAKIR